MTLEKKLWGWVLVGAAGLSLVGLWVGWQNAPLPPSDLSAEILSDLMYWVGWITVVVATDRGHNDLRKLFRRPRPKKEFPGAGIPD